MKFLLIDHYDSFTYNVMDWLYKDRRVSHVEVIPYDQLVDDNLSRYPSPWDAWVLSPGPKSPHDIREVYESKPVRKLWMSGSLPILGVCLGHQLLAYLAGAAVQPCGAPLHGGVHNIQTLWSGGILKNMPPLFQAAGYHSLAIEPEIAGYRLSATTYDPEAVPMVIEKMGAPQEAWRVGLQFHPESFLSPGCLLLLRTWVDHCAENTLRREKLKKI